jgi:hypothetical protein
MVATYIYIYHHIINGYHIYITINNSHPIRLRMTTAIPKKPTASRGAARRVRLLVDFPPGLLRGPGHHSKPLEAAGHHSNRRNETPGKSTNGWESLRNSKILIALRNFCLFMFQRLKPGGLGSCATKGRSVGESLALCAFGRPENGGFSSKEVNF